MDLLKGDVKIPVYIISNILSSVCIVLCNKWVFVNYGYRFGIFVTFVHFLVTFAGLFVCARANIFQVKHLSLYDILPLSISFCGFVVLTNLSLQYNSVQFYQVMKILTTPCIVMLQKFMYGVELDWKLQMSLLPVCLGVAITTAADFETSLLGTMIALAGVLVTSQYQIWAGTKQKELGASSMQLLYYQTPSSAFMLVWATLIMEDVPAIVKFNYTPGLLSTLVVSAACAFGVNLSTFLVIGSTSAVTYNVVGHLKTCIIIVGGTILFGTPVTWMSMIGVSLALGGIFMYTHLKLKMAAEQKAREAREMSSKV
eukprot:GFYU01008205.1.p1 GENE.GFYU01008205.1~~GFYU01008205.1.p1  ORF type:complete len:358 (-),score=72.21 GFYU01008205.1:147-1085(-)